MQPLRAGVGHATLVPNKKTVMHSVSPFPAPLSWAAACMVATTLAVASSSRPSEYLDQGTGATVAVVGEPLVFARERSGFARDYVTLSAAVVDQSGRLSYVLVGYIWSVGSSTRPKEAQSAGPGLILQADDRRVELSPQTRAPRDLGIGVPVHPPPVGSATPYVYVTDLATVELLAESSHLALLTHDQDASANYQLFADGRRALKEFVRFATAKF